MEGSWSFRSWYRRALSLRLHKISVHCKILFRKIWCCRIHLRLCTVEDRVALLLMSVWLLWSPSRSCCRCSHFGSGQLVVLLFVLGHQSSLLDRFSAQPEELWSTCPLSSLSSWMSVVSGTVSPSRYLHHDSRFAFLYIWETDIINYIAAHICPPAPESSAFLGLVDRNWYSVPHPRKVVDYENGDGGHTWTAR